MCAAAALAVSAHASPIQYTFSFTASGSLGSQVFTNQPVSITISADTSSVQVIPPPGPANLNHGTAVIDIAGLPRANVTSFLQIYTNFNNFGLSNSNFSILDYSGLAGSIATWDLSVPIGPLSPPFVGENWLSGSGPNIVTDRGGLAVTNGTASQWRFTATVPEPGCLCVFALGGTIACRRRR